MKTFFNHFLSAFAVLFAIPSFLILVSWNAIPGDSLYTVKTGLEDITLAVTMKTPLASYFSLNFTERRFSEANRLLAKKGSTLGYTLLVSEARETKQIVVDKGDTRKAEELVQKIEEYQARIEEKKAAISAQPTAILPPSGQTPLPLSPQTSPVAATPTPQTQVRSPEPTAKATQIPVPTPAPSAQVVIEDLEATSQKLQEIKEEIKRELPPQSSERAKEVRHDNRDRNRDKKEGDD